MARITATELKQIYTTSISDGALQPFIDAANLLVNEELSASGLSDDRKKIIELYLAAHFTTITLEKGGLLRKKIGDAEEEYQAFNSRNIQVLGLTATRFGQQALLLDTSGKLGALSAKPVKAQFKVVSTVPNSAIGDPD